MRRISTALRDLPTVLRSTEDGIRTAAGSDARHVRIFLLEDAQSETLVVPQVRWFILASFWHFDEAR